MNSAKDAFTLVERRWLLRIVACLMVGPSRFTDLRGMLPRLSAKILAQRLEEMIADGLVTRDELSARTKIPVYALTPEGLALMPVITAIEAWASASLYD